MIVMQRKDIADEPILRFLARRNGGWATSFSGFGEDVGLAMPADVPQKLKLAKMRSLIKRGLVTGCACGCRGDFGITDAGLAIIADEHLNRVARAPFTGIVDRRTTRP